MLFSLPGPLQQLQSLLQEVKPLSMKDIEDLVSHGGLILLKAFLMKVVGGSLNKYFVKIGPEVRNNHWLDFHISCACDALKIYRALTWL